jgi:predicted glycosyltransferase
MHGDRTDQSHQIIYNLADSLVALYDKSVAREPSLQPYMHKTSFTKMLRIKVSKPLKTIPKTVTVLTSSGSNGVGASDIAYAAAQTPDWHWIIIGKLNTSSAAQELPANCDFKGFVDDPDTYLSSASIIITSGGHNAIARTLSHEKPFIVAPESRPFDEQQSFATIIHDVYGVPCITSWQETDWPYLLNDTPKNQDPTSTASHLLSTPDEHGAAITDSIERAVRMTSS